MNKKYILSIAIILIIIIGLVAYAKFHVPTINTVAEPATVPSAKVLGETAPLNPSPTPAPEEAPISVGSVTWHQDNFIGREVFLVGYVLKKEKGYVIFSDEPTGAITAHDLPVSGVGIEDLSLKQKYTFRGIFLDKGLKASNGSIYHLELSEAPQPVLLK